MYASLLIDLEMCLPELTAEVNVSVVVIRATEGFCKDSNFVESIQEAIESDYNSSTISNGCLIGRLILATCSEQGK